MLIARINLSYIQDPAGFPCLFDLGDAGWGVSLMD
jgi:hypothetical protein